MKLITCLTFFFFLYVSICNGQKQPNLESKNIQILNEKLIAKNFTNKYIVENTKGQVFKIDSMYNYGDVLVLWANGYFSIGKLSLGHAFGEWDTYDKKNRLRKRVGFGDNGEMLLYIIEFDKKGNVTKNSSSSVPF